MLTQTGILSSLLVVTQYRIDPVLDRAPNESEHEGPRLDGMVHSDDPQSRITFLHFHVKRPLFCQSQGQEDIGCIDEFVRYNVPSITITIS